MSSIVSLCDANLQVGLVNCKCSFYQHRTGRHVRGTTYRRRKATSRRRRRKYRSADLPYFGCHRRCILRRHHCSGNQPDLAASDSLSYLKRGEGLRTYSIHGMSDSEVYFWYARTGRVYPASAAVTVLRAVDSIVYSLNGIVVY